VLAVVFPMLVLISTATWLAADRREERFAALRLVGATPGDIRIVAGVEAVISVFLGAVLGTVVFLVVRPALARAGACQATRAERRHRAIDPEARDVGAVYCRLLTG
jgi:hypothetical protein